MKLKKFFCMVMLLGMSTTVFAAEELENEFSVPKKVIISETDLNEIDLNKSFTLTERYVDENGTPVDIKSTYTPVVQTRGSSTTTATVGTWKSEVTYGVVGMSYEFDLSKSGTQWEISNGRNLNYHGVLCSFSDASLKISRAVSTDSFPAEINASVTAAIGAPEGVTVVSSVFLLNTKVSSGGTVTTTWN